MSPEYVLALMAEIEKNKPLSGSNEADGRFTWCERWEALRKMLKRLGEEV